MGAIWFAASWVVCYLRSTHKSIDEIIKMRRGGRLRVTVDARSIHRERFRASALHHFENQAVLPGIAEVKCLWTTPSLLSRATLIVLPTSYLDRQPCAKITAYNQHCSAPFFRALVVLQQSSLLGPRSRRRHLISQTTDYSMRKTTSTRVMTSTA